MTLSNSRLPLSLFGIEPTFKIHLIASQTLRGARFSRDFVALRGSATGHELSRIFSVTWKGEGDRWGNE